jgi:predicted nucleic acid-binding protein
VTLIYADTSALLRAYFVDEPDHAALRALLLEGEEPVVSSELARVEFAAAIGRVRKARRLRRWRDLLARFDADCQEEGPIALVRLRPDIVLPVAYRLVVEHALRTLDALHLAVALEEGPRLAGGGDMVFVTRDAEQAAAARAMGLVVR